MGGCCGKESERERRARLALTFEPYSPPRNLPSEVDFPDFGDFHPGYPLILPRNTGFLPNYDLDNACVICLTAGSGSDIRCSGDSNGNGGKHRYCASCFDTYVSQTFCNRDFSVTGPPKHVTCCAQGCDGRFGSNRVAAHVRTETWEKLSAMVHRLKLSAFLAELVVECERHAGSGAAVLAVLSKRSEALMIAGPNTLSCPRCGYVVVHEACDDLSAHHGEKARASGGTISNQCRFCGFFSTTRKDWLPFDGTSSIPTEEEMAARFAGWHAKRATRDGAKEASMTGFHALEVPQRPAQVVVRGNPFPLIPVPTLPDRVRSRSPVAYDLLDDL